MFKGLSTSVLQLPDTGCDKDRYFQSIDNDLSGCITVALMLLVSEAVQTSIIDSVLF